jgi:hypothetical protein
MGTLNTCSSSTCVAAIPFCVYQILNYEYIIEIHILYVEVCIYFFWASVYGDQEISLLSRNPKEHHRVHNSPPLDPSLSNMNPMQTIITCCIRDPFYYYLPSTPRSPKLSLAYKFSKQIQYQHFVGRDTDSSD